MAERMVQVPVSLIERAPHEVGCASLCKPGHANYGPCGCWKAEATALLSQPTPSADPCPDCKGTGESLDSSRRHSGLPTVGRCDTCGGTGRAPAAAPPRIEDMAPGTRCREEVPGTVPSWAGEDQISPCLCVLDAGHDGRHRCDHQVDPSTIRDVTPPKEQP